MSWFFFIHFYFAMPHILSPDWAHICSSLFHRSKWSNVVAVSALVLLVWPVPLAQVLPRPQMIFLPKSDFFGEFIWIFSGRNRLKINISHTWNPNLNK
jgi:hypothetical protein